VHAVDIEGLAGSGGVDLYCARRSLLMADVALTQIHLDEASWARERQGRSRMEKGGGKRVGG
jgi:hypothetical protein